MRLGVAVPVCMFCILRRNQKCESSKKQLPNMFTDDLLKSSTSHVTSGVFQVAHPGTHPGLTRFVARCCACFVPGRTCQAFFVGGAPEGLRAVFGRNRADREGRNWINCHLGWVRVGVLVSPRGHAIPYIRANSYPNANPFFSQPHRFPQHQPTRCHPSPPFSSSSSPSWRSRRPSPCPWSSGTTESRTSLPSCLANPSHFPRPQTCQLQGHRTRQMRSRPGAKGQEQADDPSRPGTKAMRDQGSRWNPG